MESHGMKINVFVFSECLLYEHNLLKKNAFQVEPKHLLAASKELALVPGL